MILIILGKHMLLKPEKRELRIDRPFQFNRDLFQKAITKISLVILIGDIKKKKLMVTKNIDCSLMQKNCKC